MNRTEIEKIITSQLSDNLAKKGFTLSESSYSGDRFAKFCRREGDALYTFSMSFLKNGKIDVYILVSYQPVDELFAELSGSKKQEYHVFSISVRMLLNPKNQKSGKYFITGDTVDFYQSDKIAKGENLDEVINSFFEEYFTNIVPEIIEKTKTLELADKLINSIPIQLDEEGDPKILLYSSSLVNQILNGLMIAFLTKNPDLKQLVKVYNRFTDNYEDGRIEDIDLTRKLIQLF